eukprot:TRINITY_DN574_c0_g4_i1.p1 TRINITY_DN574_c0_g4~~TRINITY_DN574_c0_g4_i1.p1  ORF type:complete len:349 (-),score=116.46 TRINITY_DN574_c0_g4_i1:67-1089(-)
MAHTPKRQQLLLDSRSYEKVSRATREFSLLAFKACNEPSLGLYYVQENIVQNVTKFADAKRALVKQCQHVENASYGADYCLTTLRRVKGMQTFQSIKELLGNTGKIADDIAATQARLAQQRLMAQRAVRASPRAPAGGQQPPPLTPLKAAVQTQAPAGAPPHPPPQPQQQSQQQWQPQQPTQPQQQRTQEGREQALPQAEPEAQAQAQAQAAQAQAQVEPEVQPQPQPQPEVQPQPQSQVEPEAQPQSEPQPQPQPEPEAQPQLEAQPQEQEQQPQPQPEPNPQPQADVAATVPQPEPQPSNAAGEEQLQQPTEEARTELEPVLAQPTTDAAPAVPVDVL